MSKPPRRADQVPVEQRLPILEPLLARGEDAADTNLPFLIWYALEPVVGSDAAKAATLLPQTKIPVLQEYIARRMATTASTK